jgi:hypothetical protein
VGSHGTKKAVSYGLHTFSEDGLHLQGKTPRIVIAQSTRKICPANGAMLESRFKHERPQLISSDADQRPEFTQVLQEIQSWGDDVTLRSRAEILLPEK